MNRDKLIKIICWTSIFLSVWSVAPHIIKDAPEFIYKFQALNISDYFIRWITRSNLGNINFLYLTLNLILGFGGIYTLFTKLKDSSFLRFSWLLIFNYNLFKIFELILYTKQKASSFNPHITTLDDIFHLIIFHFIITLIAIYFCKLLLHKQYNLIENSAYKLTTRFQRFIHFVVDNSLAMLLTFTALFLIENVFQINSRNLILFFISLASLLYYLLNELLFKSTPGKILTNSIVLEEGFNKPRQSTLLARNLARKIPLNPVSFIFKKNWHDNISKSNVYKSGNVSASLIAIPTAFVLMTVCYVVGSVSSIKSTENFKLKKDEYYNEIENIKHKTKLESLTKGNSILLSKYNSEENTILNISDVKGDIIKGAIKNYKDNRRHVSFKYLSEIPFDPFNFDSNDTLTFSKTGMTNSKPHNAGTIKLSYRFNKFKGSDSSEYRIKELLTKDCPRFDKDGTTFKNRLNKENKQVSIFILRTRDYDFKITDIELTSGKGEWITKTPLDVTGSLNLEFINEQYDEKKESIITISSNNKVFKFKLFILGSYFDIVPIDN